MTDVTLDRIPHRPGFPIALGIAIASAGLAVLWGGFGILSPISLVLLAAGSAAVLIGKPGWLFALTPSLLFVPNKQTVFVFEMALVVLTALVVLYGLRRRAEWLSRLDPIEIANLAFVGWALFTVFWCGDLRIYGHGARKLLVGVAAFWVAYRAAHLVSRRVYESGLLGGALLLATMAMARYAGRTGFGAHEVDRASATNLGWGTANLIAGLLLVLSPTILDQAMRNPSPVQRVLAWITSGVVAVMQLLIASRAASVLYVCGLLTQFGRGRRRRWPAVMLILAATVGAFFTPAGQALLERFSNPRELGGMVVRIWYWREAARRAEAAFPYGLGLNQGYVQPDKLHHMGTHDYWLDLISELGPVGVVLWIVVLVVIWRRLRAIERTPGWSNEGAALKLAFVLAQLHTIVEPTFVTSHYQFVFFWVMGGFAGYHAQSLRTSTLAGARPRPERPET